MSKHPQANHPAVGVLDCARNANGKSFTRQDPTDDHSLCSWCGMDEAFHALTIADYEGPKPRPDPWDKREAAVRATLGEHSEHHEPPRKREKDRG